MKKLTFLLSAAALIVLTSCDKDEPETPIIPNEEELITTVTYYLTSMNSEHEAVFQFVDLDGDGGNPPVITGDTLEANSIYSGSITLYNALETPAEDITLEVQEESAEHQMFYISSTPDVSVAYADLDGEGFPIGIDTQLTTGEAGSGTLTIILKHEPNKSAEGVSDGDITNAGGETDIEVVFDVIVE